MRKLVYFMFNVCVWMIVGIQNTLAVANPWQLNMHHGVTPISHDMYHLHMIAIYICAVIGLLVFGVMIYSLIHHRKSKGYVPAKFHDHPKLEVVWSLIPFFILVGLAFPATSVLLRMSNTEDSDVTIKIIGSQWKWQYQYLNEGISYYSLLSTPFEQIQNKEPKGEWYLLEVDKPLVLPIQKKIRFLVTSQDVVHSWWVPELGVKRDAIPGYMYEAWAWIEKPGTYRGQCAELCGINHAYMPIVVQAVKPEDYQKWVAEQVKVQDQYAQVQSNATAQPEVTRDELMKLGKTKYNQACAACHLTDGQGIPPLYPALKASSIAVGKPISRHILLILNGVAGSAMQAYRDLLSDKEVAAIVTYERNAWGNNTNDTVQPADVAKVRINPAITPKIVSQAKVGGFR